MLHDLLETLYANKISVVNLERLSRKEFTALQLCVNVPDVEESTLLHIGEAIQNVAYSNVGADIVFQQDNLARWTRRLIVFDIDSTLVQQNLFDEVAKVAGIQAQVIETSESEGEIDFAQELRNRVQFLKGQKASHLFDTVNRNLVFTPGARWLCQVLKHLGYKIAGISNSFLPLAWEVKRVLDLHYVFANRPEVDNATGCLTGETTGPLVTPKRKRALLAMIANVEGCDVSQTIAVGDSTQDIPMLKAAGLGVAFCAKPKVKENAKVHIHHLSGVLFLLGISSQAAMNFGVDVEADA